VHDCILDPFATRHGHSLHTPTSCLYCHSLTVDFLPKVDFLLKDVVAGSAAGFEGRLIVL
jgi:hypothetical protein